MVLEGEGLLEGGGDDDAVSKLDAVVIADAVDVGDGEVGELVKRGGCFILGNFPFLEGFGGAGIAYILLKLISFDINPF